MNISWIITPLSGAVIGYFTNWLAVKMLFRPHTEKRIFGLRIPMTPGLIPKEKARLANKIGQTLAKNVLTEEELVNAVSHPEVMSKLTDLFDKFLNDLANGVYAGQTENILDMAAGKAAELLENGGGVLSGMLDGLKEKLIKKGAEYLEGEGFTELISGFVEDFSDKLSDNPEPLRAYLPNDLNDIAAKALASRLPDIILLLKALPERFPDIDDRLRQLVQRIAEDNFGAFLGVFIHYDQLYDKIKTSLFNYLDDPENQAYVREKAVVWVKRAMDKPVNEIFAMIPEDLRGQAPASITGIVKRGLDGGAAKKLLDKAGEINLPDLLKRFVPDIKGTVLSILRSLADSFITSLDGDNMAALRESAISLILKAAQKGGAYVITSMRFDRLIENKISDFSVEEAETLIVSVVDKELKSITWLGGVLGLVIGFVPLITEMLGLG